MGPAPPLTAPVVRVEGLVKRYRRRVAVANATLQVRAGELYGVIGPDGAGKSSLFKAVAGVLEYEGGEVAVFGQPIVSEQAAERVKDRIGFMPQGLGLNLYPELSVEENIDFFAQLRAVQPGLLAQRKARLLAMTRLERFRARPMKNLSGGMKQKLALVCTLIHEPELVILDEPTTGVDPVSRRDFWRILAELLRERGVTALVSTAYLDEASRFDRIALMYGGQILAEGDPESLRAEFAAASDAQLEPDLEDLFIARMPHGTQRLLSLPAAARPAPPGGVPAHTIEARSLTRDFGAFRAVDGVSFRVAKGEIFGLLGANGAGKTTVIKMLTGILPPSGGVGQVAGADMRRARREIRQRIGYMSQSFSLYADLTVLENVLLYAGIYGLLGAAARRGAEWVIELGGLTEYVHDAVGELPMGLRQRVALGCALVHHPQVLFLDEPTSGVDPLGRRHFWNILFWLAREQTVSILLTTHHMSEAELCDRLVLMHDGRAVADASPAEMKQEVEREAGQLLDIRAEPAARALELLAAARLGEGVLHGRHIHLLVADAARAAPLIRDRLETGGVAVQSIAPQALTMEDVFVYRVSALQRSARGTA